MTTFSIDAIWEEMIVFLRREIALVLPLALATFGIGLLLFGLASDVRPQPGGAIPQPGPQMLWVLPAFLLNLLGNLAISLVVLRPGTTVGDSLRLALTRLPAALGIAGLGLAVLLLIAIVATLVAIGIGVSTNNTNLLVVLLCIPGLWLSVRLLVLWPVLADTGRGPIDTLRAAFALTRGHALKALAITMIFLLVYMTLISIAQLVLGSLFQLVAIAVGNAELLKLIVGIVVAFIGAVLMMGWTVYLAFAYRRLRI